LQSPAWHVPPLQTPESQSLAFTHVAPALQGLQAPPPQSIPDSAPFLAPSVQVAGWHMRSWHTELLQSGPTLQF
jgi:hypothetical protein